MCRELGKATFFCLLNRKWKREPQRVSFRCSSVLVSFIHSFEYVLGTYYMLNSLPGAMDMVVNKISPLSFCGLYSREG